MSVAASQVLTPAACFAALEAHGVIVRDVGDALRISVGTEDENLRFLTALDEVLA